MTPIHPVTLLFSDGASVRVEVPEGQRLLEITSQAGLNLILDCANGKCGTCTANLVSGTVNLDDYDSSILPDEDRRCGVILPCVSRIIEPCAIEFPYDSSEALSDEPAPMPGRIISKTPVGSEILQLLVEVDQNLLFEPGQYVQIRPAGSDFTRSYSMSNCPGSNRLEFFIRLVPEGKFSTWLESAVPGAEMVLSAPRGTFFLRTEPRPRLFVAGGTGLAPFLAMLRSLPIAVENQTTLLIVGARTPRHLMQLEELEVLRTQLKGFDYRLAIENESETVQGSFSGYPTDLISNLDLPTNTRVYLCGPPPMVEAGRKAVTSAGLNGADILCERFS
jgi:NAD(P)H-flavin reductase/ferredoxin